MRNCKQQHFKVVRWTFVNQGRFYRIVPGSYEEVNISNGMVGQKDMI